MEFHDYLRIEREKAGMTQKEVAEKIGVSRSAYTLYETGKRQPDPLQIKKMAKALGISANAFFPDTMQKIKESEEFPYSAAALEFARQFDQLDKWGRAAVSAVIREEIQRCTAPAPDLAEIIELPHSLLSASAGTGQWLDDDTADIWEVRLNEHTRKADFAVDVAGDSMEPLYSDGDTVLVHAQPAINEGEVGLYVYRGDGYIKRQGDGRLHSLNPEYPDIVPCDGEAIVCKGLVLGKLDDAWVVSK